MPLTPSWPPSSRRASTAVPKKRVSTDKGHRPWTSSTKTSHSSKHEAHSASMSTPPTLPVETPERPTSAATHSIVGPPAPEHQALRDQWLQLLAQYVETLLAVGHDTWRKAMSREDNSAAVTQFMQEDACRALFIVAISREEVTVWTNASSTKSNDTVPINNSEQQSTAGETTRSQAWLSQPMHRLLYIMKPPGMQTPSTHPPAFNDLIKGKYVSSPLSHLHHLISTVLLPLTRLPKTLLPWSRAVRCDLAAQWIALQQALCTLNTFATGKVTLALPDLPQPNEIDRAQSVQILETTLTTWSQDIHHYLNQDAFQLTWRLPQSAQWWQERVHCLNGLVQQFSSEAMKLIRQHLVDAGSTFAHTLIRLESEVNQACSDSLDALKYLKTLLPWFDNNVPVTFEILQKKLPAVIKTLSLIHEHSKHYDKSEKWLTLMVMVANAYMDKTRALCHHSGMLKDEYDEHLERLQSASYLSQQFMQMIQTLCQQFHCPLAVESHWLSRWQSYLHRQSQVHALMTAAKDYATLEKIELGAKGKHYAGQIQQLAQVFEQRLTTFKQTQYDLLDVDIKAFDSAYEAFEQELLALDKQLSQLISYLLQSENDLMDAIKTFEMLTLLESRPRIKTALMQCSQPLVEWMHQEFDSISKMLKSQDQITLNQVFRDSTLLVHTCRWLRALEDRVRIPYQRLVALSHDTSVFVFSSTLERHYQLLLQQIKTRHAIVLEEWQNMTVNRIQKHYESHVLKMTDASMSHALSHAQATQAANERRLRMQVSFDQNMAATMHDIRYLMTSSLKLPLSPIIETFSQRIHVLHDVVAMLQIVREQYNELVSKPQTTETFLLRALFNQLDDIILHGSHALTWSAEEQVLLAFSHQAYDAVQQMALSMGQVLELRAQLYALAEQWTLTPLIQREDAYRPIHLESLNEKISSFHASIIADGREMQQALTLQAERLQMDHSGPVWLRYLKDYDLMIASCLIQTVKQSLSALHQAASEAKAQGPLMEVTVHLQQGELWIQPLGQHRSLHSYFDDLVEQCFLKLGSLLHTFTLPDETYIRVLRRNEDIQSLTSALFQVLDAAGDSLQETILQLDQFTELFQVTPQAALNRFLLHLVPKQEENNSSSSSDPQSLSFSAILLQNESYLNSFQQEMIRMDELLLQVEQLPKEKLIHDWLRVNASHARQLLVQRARDWSQVYKNYLLDQITKHASYWNTYLEGLLGSFHALEQNMTHDDNVRQVSELLLAQSQQDLVLERMTRALAQGCQVLEAQMTGNNLLKSMLDPLLAKWDLTRKLAASLRAQMAPLRNKEAVHLRQSIEKHEKRVVMFKEQYLVHAPLSIQISLSEAYRSLHSCHLDTQSLELEQASLQQLADLYDVEWKDNKILANCRRDLQLLKSLWDWIGLVLCELTEWTLVQWQDLDCDQFEGDCKHFLRELKSLDRDVRQFQLYQQLTDHINGFTRALNTVVVLKNPAIRPRHWQELTEVTGLTLMQSPEQLTMRDLLAMRLHDFEDDVQSIVDRATKEFTTEKTLSTIESVWQKMTFPFERHSGTGIPLLGSLDTLIQQLEEHQVILQSLLSSKHINYFMTQVKSWHSQLMTVDAVTSVWMAVQRTWQYLQNIYSLSQDMRTQLPEDTQRFDDINARWTILMQQSETYPLVIESCYRQGFLAQLESLQVDLSKCERVLSEYLETKRKAFSRFYFVSASDLLDILANGNQPLQVMRHFNKLFDNIAKLEMNEQGYSMAMISAEGERVPFTVPFECNGPVEQWLERLVQAMRQTLIQGLETALSSYEEKSRDLWLFDHPAQIALVTTQIWWSLEVSAAFARMEEGYEHAMKDYYRKQVRQLTKLIQWIQSSDLSAIDRRKIMTISTIDLHARDVVGQLINEKDPQSAQFIWHRQLHHHWDDAQRQCLVSICDARLSYCYEYLGNSPRLVITPLSERCYVTLTQALRLVMGGAPAGPAGTGKTETVKDLGKAIGVMVSVFNCSDQMDYKLMGLIFKGLAVTGSWACFDEINRISAQVLSIVATQVKSILDAIRAQHKTFYFQGDHLELNTKLGIFITLNPTYTGRAELPESLKSLFRPCAMAVPDLEQICEVMLVSEGFIDTKTLAKKCTTLYSMSKLLLSAQDHYDWGLRAMKSVLVVAGTLKRNDPQIPEEWVLMRALRDYNLPKISHADIPVFKGIVADIFPGHDLPRKKDPNFERALREVLVANGLQPEDAFVLKMIQMHELLTVRHSLFILGHAATGKSSVWQSLAQTYRKLGQKVHVHDLNPKAVSDDELFGYVNKTTGEWLDGLLPSLMRPLSQMNNTDMKWLLLDGDIAPSWAETLNATMDDNRILTLASNERIVLTSSMRLIFEAPDLHYANPSTVSRAGIIAMNPTDLHWTCFIQSWLDKRQATPQEKALLPLLFERYLPHCFEMVKQKFKFICPLTDYEIIQFLCHALDATLGSLSVNGFEKDLTESAFVYCCIWAFGAALVCEQVRDYRLDFSNWWRSTFTQVKFPGAGIVFDYYIDKRGQFQHWADRLESLNAEESVGNGNVSLESSKLPFVYTHETARIRNFVEMLASMGKPVLLAGGIGNGKSMLMESILSSKRDANDPMNGPLVETLHFHYFTDAMTIQQTVDQHLERKVGKTYAPVNNRKLWLFLDNLNVSATDSCGTQRALTVLKQYLDYGHWYDRQHWQLNQIQDVALFGCMNPQTGSLDPRFQRHFHVLAVNAPSQESARDIYLHWIQQGTQQHKGWLLQKQSVARLLVDCSIELHRKVSALFSPTALKCHYQFNQRHLSQFIQSLCYFCTPDNQSTLGELARFWVHESERVYRDMLVSEQDEALFDGILMTLIQRLTSETSIESSVLVKRPLVYCQYTEKEVNGWQALKQLLEEVLSQYNVSASAPMKIVLFESAMMHVCRVSRILQSPTGNALLVGVGGSGKQSLAHLAAFMNGMTVFQLPARFRAVAASEMKTDIAAVLMRAGIKDQSIAWILPDMNSVDEKYLALFHTLLLSGNELKSLFTHEERDDIARNMFREVKESGQTPSPDSCWRHFLAKVKRNLRLILCLSPVGKAFRLWHRRFPALVHDTFMDWFKPWPMEALQAVAASMLNVPTNHVLAQTVAHVHCCFEGIRQKWEEQEQRPIYASPKNYLSLIQLWMQLQQQRGQALDTAMQRLEAGLSKMILSSDQVDEMKSALALQEAELLDKNKKAEQLLAQVTADTERLELEKTKAKQEEAHSNEMDKQVQEKQRQCEADLSKAEPILAACERALNTLNKPNLIELKSFVNPGPEIQQTLAAVMILLLGAKRRAISDYSWKTLRSLMGPVDKFIESLVHFDKQNIAPSTLSALETYLNDPNFNGESIARKSVAAAGICEWVKNVTRYHAIYHNVKPKRDALLLANEQLQASQARLAQMTRKVEEIDQRLSSLTESFQSYTLEKNRIKQAVVQTKSTIDVANRLMAGLGSEKERWTQSVQRFRLQKETLTGDLLLCAAFITFAGAFTPSFRDQLMNQWKEALSQSHMAYAQDPLAVLNDRTKSQSKHSLDDENQWIIQYCLNIPLIVDPQCQALSTLRALDWNGRVLNASHWNETGLMERLNEMKEQLSNEQDNVKVGLLTETKTKWIVIENIKDDFDQTMPSLLALLQDLNNHQMNDNIKSKNPIRVMLSCHSNAPHFSHTLQSLSTLVYFSLTHDSLTHQLLRLVVTHERPDLESSLQQLFTTRLSFESHLSQLEDALLISLSSAQGAFLKDKQLLDQLEQTKRLASELERKVQETQKWEKETQWLRDQYRPVAERGAQLFFVLEAMRKVDWLYATSLSAYMTLFERVLKSDDLVSNTSNTNSTNNTNNANNATNNNSNETRLQQLIDGLTVTFYQFVARGLYQDHLLLFSTLLCFTLNSASLDQKQIQFLLKPTSIGNIMGNNIVGNANASSNGNNANNSANNANMPNMNSSSMPASLNWMNETAYQSLCSLTLLDRFKSLLSDMESSPVRWQKWSHGEQPEHERLPMDWKHCNALEKLCILRCVRPDRLTSALPLFIEEKMGGQSLFTRPVAFHLEESCLKHASAQMPLLFILSPGMDPTQSLEQLAQQKQIPFHVVSLGQGMLVLEALEKACREEAWIVLQNVHLAELGMKLALERWWDHYLTENANKNTNKNPSRFRLFLCVSDSKTTTNHATTLQTNSVSFQSMLFQSSMKMTLEPTRGIAANMSRAFHSLLPTLSQWQSPSKEIEFRTLVYALCQFHAIVLERGHYGAWGWNEKYPFNMGDLWVCVDILYHYLDDTPSNNSNSNNGNNMNSSNSTSSANASLPWADLRFLFGDIVYGGHISDLNDRRQCHYLLLDTVSEQVLDSTHERHLPIGLEWDQFQSHMDTVFSAATESPWWVGLHPNAEMEMLTEKSHVLMDALFSLSFSSSNNVTQHGLLTSEERLKRLVDEMLARLPEPLSLDPSDPNLRSATTNNTASNATTDTNSNMNSNNGNTLAHHPLAHITRQECVSLHYLVTQLERDLRQLDAALRGHLLFTEELETLADTLLEDHVPISWLHFPSTRRLGHWFDDILQRFRELDAWCVAGWPNVVWLSGCFHPQAVLMSVLQWTARQHHWPLDQMSLVFEITKKSKEEILAPPRQGMYLIGFLLQGARFDQQTQSLEEAFYKEPVERLPVVHCMAQLDDNHSASSQTHHVPSLNSSSTPSHSTPSNNVTMYACPLYATKKRGNALWMMGMKSRWGVAKWVVRGVACLLSAD